MEATSGTLEVARGALNVEVSQQANGEFFGPTKLEAKINCNCPIASA